MTSLFSKEFFSTGEAAELLSVTSDTILKWIRAGKLSASRTPGGHHRIPRRAVDALIGTGEGERPGHESWHPFEYCWEYYSEAGSIRADCRRCIVFNSRAQRCYDLSNLSAEEGFVGLFCKKSCRECDYRRLVYEHPPRVLVLTDKLRLRRALERQARDVEYDLKCAESEYRCSMVIERYRPDFVVVDCSIGTSRCSEIARLLSEDPRIPFVRIIFAGERRELPKACEGLVYALIDRHFTIDVLSDIVSGRSPALSGSYSSCHVPGDP